MNDASNSCALFVLGAYGSGSSAVAGILHHLGVMMGEALIPPTFANPKGHFEDAEFRRLLYQLRQDRSVLVDIERFIKGRFSSYPLWGVKEPAILEAIADIAPMLKGCRYKIIAMKRDIEASVRSYQRKWPGTDPAETRRRIEYLFQERDRFIHQWAPQVLWIDFNDLTDRPEEYVHMIAKFVFGECPSLFQQHPWPSDAALRTAIESIEPEMNHRWEVVSPESGLARQIVYQDDPVLKRWVNPYYLRPATIAAIKEASRAKPYCKYAVLDNFFNEAVLDEYSEQHRNMEFSVDDEGLPYDSNWAIARRGVSLGAELFYYEPWHRLLAEYTDTELAIGHGATSVKLRKHDPDSKGFWIHTDRTKRKSTVVVAALIYLNKGWEESDGAVLQLWAESGNSSALTPEDVEYRWQELKDERLEFLNERYSLTTDLVTFDGIRPAELFLIDQVLPEYNRLVVTDFVRDPAYHSITPSNGRARYAIVQWLM